MAQVSDLTGLGMAPSLAAKAGHQVTSGLVGIGTTQAGGAAVLTTSVTVGVPASGKTAYILPTTTQNPSMAKEFYFFNQAATAVTALIYPPNDSGSTLNGSTSGAVSVTQNHGCMFMCVSGSGYAGHEVWFAINSA